MSSSLRKRTHSITKDTKSSPTSPKPSPRKKAKESSTIATPEKVNAESKYGLRSRNRSSISKDTLTCISNNGSSKIDNNGDEINGELTHNTSSLSIGDNRNNNVGSNESSPLSSPPSSPNSENGAGNNNDDKGDTIEPLLLPNIVWVNDEKRGWWPSEIISKDKSEKPLLVRLLGQEPSEKPYTLKLFDISKSSILPFHDELFVQLRKTGENSNMKALFSKAINEAMLKETEDNDGLPSEDFAFQMVVDSSPNNKKKKSERKSLSGKRTKETNPFVEKESSNKKFTTDQETSNLSDSDFEKDGTLQIPGECVLALSSSDKKYYPAKITGYTEPDKYKVLFCYNSSGLVKRKNFFTKYEDGFKTCELGLFTMDLEDPTYEEPECVKRIQSLEPILRRILRGEENSWRFQHFCDGGKKLKLLASKVSPGPFNLSQFGLIARVLRGIFIPEIAESIDKKNKVKLAKINYVKNSISDVKYQERPAEVEAERTSESNKSANIDESIMMQQKNLSFDFQALSSDLKLRFVNDILLPETIIRLVMMEEKIGYEEADCKMLDGYNETRWVEHLMAERTSFQIGSESLRDKLLM